MAGKLRMVYGAGLAFNVSFLMIALLVPVDALRLGYPTWVVGLLAATPGVMQLPMRILSGPLTGSLGERRVLIFTFILGVVAGILAGVIPVKIVGLVLAQLTIGAARGTFWTAAQSLTAQLAPDPPKALGIFTSATKGGALLGIVASGSAAAFLGMTPAFYLAAALSLVALALAQTFPAQAPNAAPQKFRAAVKALGPVAKQPLVVVVGMVALLTALPQALAQSYYPVWLLRLHLPEQGATAVTAIQSLGMIIAGVMATGLIRRFGFRRVIISSVLLLSVALVGSGTGAIWILGICLGLSGVAAGILNVGFLSAVTAYGDKAQRSLYFGVTQVYFVVAMMAAPAVSGLVASAHSLPFMFLCDGIFTAVVGLVIALSWRWGLGRHATA